MIAWCWFDAWRQKSSLKDKEALFKN